MAETRIPKVGETVLLEGLPRAITELTGPNGRTVHFDNPPDAPHAVWKRSIGGDVVRSPDGAKVIESGFPSRAGAVGMSSLSLINASPAIWGVRGRVEAPKNNPNATQLEAAEYNINKPPKKAAKAKKRGSR